MDQNNSPDARRALYLNQAEGLLHQRLRFPLVLSTLASKNHNLPLSKPYSSPEFAPINTQERNSDRMAVLRWIDQWRARRNGSVSHARQFEGGLDQAS
ncbi:MAG: hypothetical protein QOH97_5709 [Actinoplanes sp.]|jgi:hypothetical protein|nr:hypothetical protein [Actinoplanes sp.]